MIFKGLEFLLTGFSHPKEKEVEALIRRHGGYVLVSIPSDPPVLRGKKRAQLAWHSLPIVISPRKVCFHPSKSTCIWGLRLVAFYHFNFQVQSYL